MLTDRTLMPPVLHKILIAPECKNTVYFGRVLVFGTTKLDLRVAARAELWQCCIRLAVWQREQDRGRKMGEELANAYSPLA